MSKNRTPKNKPAIHNSLIPNTVKEITVEPLKHLCAFKEQTQKNISQLFVLSTKAIESNERVTNKVIESYDFLLKAYSDDLKRDDLTYEQRQDMWAKMREIPERETEIASDHTDCIQNTIHKSTYVILCSIAVGCSVLGGTTAIKKFINKPKP